MSKPATPVVLPVGDWVPSSIRYMQPKVNDRGGKSINIISTQTNRSLHIATPLMMTWGIADYVDEKTGESDGKFSISLNFPSDDYATPATTDFLKKMKDFENQILDDAVKNSEAWFGEEMSRDVVKHTFFPFLKFPKDKVTKKTDFTKAPSIRPKVPNYDNRWAVEIYDTESKRLFPSDNPVHTPMDYVPKKSNIASVIQCSGLWFGGKGWGLTWKFVQGVVKPSSESQTVFGRCHIQLSNDELKTLDKQPAQPSGDEEDDSEVPSAAAVSTEVEDSDEEAEAEVEPEPVVSVPVKKVVKKAVEAEPEAAEPEPAKKKVVKKKVVA